MVECVFLFLHILLTEFFKTTFLILLFMLGDDLFFMSNGCEINVVHIRQLLNRIPSKARDVLRTLEAPVELSRHAASRTKWESNASVGS